MVSLSNHELGLRLVLRQAQDERCRETSRRRLPRGDQTTDCGLVGEVDAAVRRDRDRPDAADAILNAGEGDAAFDAWTLEELEDDLGSMRSAFAGSAAAAG